MLEFRTKALLLRSHLILGILTRSHYVVTRVNAIAIIIIYIIYTVELMAHD